MPTEFWGIIPARYQSTRFPGKPLTPILGKPMYQWVYEQACQCGQLEGVVLATDSDQIADHARKQGVPVVMTRSDHPSGSDRVREAAEKMGLPDAAVVINIQGDEPALHPEMLVELIGPFSDPAVQVTTLIRKEDQRAPRDPNQVKVVVDNAANALYFSRADIPMNFGGHTTPWYRHIGLYAYRLPVLRRFVDLGPGRLERIEKLEQLRLLENGIPIRTVITRHRSQGVDRPADVAIAQQLIQHRHQQT
ncbi:MAG: 3-deoxy-manno-octulosonate cytidylyltransferase [Desulfobacterales bacterium]|jgi:3-deoxy-manno-octulosonate cytidylyltransferase (CMP-KDO synthetase)